MVIGWGGISHVSESTGVSRTTITEGIKELNGKKKIPQGKIRQQGGGRKKKAESHPEIKESLESFLEPYTRGDPMTPLKWTCKSTRNVSRAMKKQGCDVSHRLIARELDDLGYSLQANKKSGEGASHPDRDKQFRLINENATQFIQTRQPVISVDTKKKEKIGAYKNEEQEYAPKGHPVNVNMHDFPDKELGKVAPYGVYDLSLNTGWVNVGISSDTAEFAVNSIRKWDEKMGRNAYPKAKKMFMTADCGGSNGNRTTLWKLELQKLADELKKEIHVSHVPPGTSKWNKIEHSMLSFITKNWRGKPLATRATVVNLIANTTTEKGLKILAEIDEKMYEAGIQVSEEELAQISLYRYKFHGEWNYKISPRN